MTVCVVDPRKGRKKTVLPLARFLTGGQCWPKCRAPKGGEGVHVVLSVFSSLFHYLRWERVD